MVTADTIRQALQCDIPSCDCHKPNGRLHCPAHADSTPSLSVNEKNFKVLVKCFGGCSQDRVIEALKAKNLWPSRTGDRPQPKFKITATYDYHDAAGKLLFQVCRLDPKDFRQRRPDGKGGWVWNMKGVKLVPYRLPEILKADTVIVVEGEKDCDRLALLGLTATTNPGGAGKWRKDFAQHFKGKAVVILPDNDEPGHDHAQEVARNLQGVAASVKILALPGLPEKGDVSDWIHAGGTVEQLLALAEEAPKWEPPAQESQTACEDSPSGSSSTWPYWIKDGVIGYDQHTRNGSTPVRLTNFTARIVGEIFKDDGAETKNLFVIDGADQQGRAYHTFEVPAQQFSGLGWVTANWGTRPVVYAGFGVKDHVRCAIQILSGEVPRHTIYMHLGWRKINEKWLYLHCGGAIGVNGPVAGVEVILGSSQMQGYRLPPVPSVDKLILAVKASLGLRTLAPPQLSYPLLAATYRAPLGECAHVDLTLFLAGHTGVYKTELTVIAQSHYGAAFNRLNLPGNWATTSNALEYQAFQAKDALLTVDDFAPRGTVTDVQRLNKEADRLLRAQGNRAGRGRMRPDGSLRPSYYPRGLILTSGEDIPTGQSLRARMLVLEVKPGDVDLAQLTAAQQAGADGLFAQAIAGYLQWLAPRIEGLKRTLIERQRELRAAARREGSSHEHTPEIWASLMVGFEKFLEFALDIGAISDAEKRELFQECWRALRQASRAQDAHQKSEDPSKRFLALLGAAIASGRAHIADNKTLEEPKQADQWGWREKIIGTGENTRAEWQSQGDRVGWLDGDNLLLEPDAAFAMVQRLGRDQGTSLPITQRTLWKRMDESGLLTSKESSQHRNTVRWLIGGDRKRVVHIKTSALLSPKTGPNGPNGPHADNHADLGTEKVDRFSGNRQGTVPENGPEVFEGRKDTDRLAAWDAAISQVVGEAVQALNPDEDLKEMVL